MSKVFMKQVLTGIVLGLVVAALAAAEQGQGQRPSPPPGRDGQRAGGPPPDGGQRMKWWQDHHMIAELRLAPEQSARIEEIWQSSVTKMTPVVDELRKREEQLSNLIYGKDVTEAEVLKQAEQVEALRGSFGKSRTLMLYRMRRVLTAEQRTKLADLLQKAQDRGRQGRQPDRDPGER